MAYKPAFRAYRAGVDN